MNLNIIGKPAYKLELPSNIARVYLMSYVSHLRKNLRVSDEEIHTEDMDLQDPLEYLEHFMKNFGSNYQRNQKNDHSFYKALWGNNTEQEAYKRAHHRSSSPIPHPP